MVYYESENIVSNFWASMNDFTIVFKQFNASRPSTSGLISGFNGTVVTSQNGGDKAQT